MKATSTAIPDVKIIEPRVFADDRGFFLESFNERVWQEEAGITGPFVQDNHSRSGRNVVRGLHYQLGVAQGKLVRAAVGSIYDVAVDMRRRSPTFGKWVGVELSAENQRQLWVPIGFAHGFLVTSENAEVLYKSTDYYDPPSERCLLWNDPEVGIQWPLQGEPQLSEKDRSAPVFTEADYFD